MKELQNIIAWVNSFNGPEVECESLVEWLEMEDRAALRRGSLVFGRIMVGLAGFAGTSFLAGLASVALFRLPITLGAVALDFALVLVGGVLGSVGLVRVCFGPRMKALARSDRDADAMRAIAQLRNVHGYRGLRAELGEQGVMELNEGAQLFLRCRSTLNTPAWMSDSPENPWTEARNELLRGMEAAMERLTLYVVKKRPFSDIGPVLDEMRAASNEIQRITEQRSSVSGGAGRDLRASLARMKELAAAEDELLRVRE